MVERRTLAFVARAETLECLPRDARIVPLRPSVRVPVDRLLVQHPEDLLDPATVAGIEARALEFVRTWSSEVSIASAFAWRGENLAACFRYELRFAVRDALKAASVVALAVDRAEPFGIAADVPSFDGVFPPYPYLQAIGSLSERVAMDRGIPYKDLAPRQQRRRTLARPSLSTAYGRLAARQALSTLRQDRPVLGIGPHPEFYLPLAAALHRTGGSIVVVSPSTLAVRASPRAGLYFAPVEAFVEPADRGPIRALVDGAVENLHLLRVLGGALDPTPFVRSHIAARTRDQLPVLASLGLGFARGLERSEHIVLMESASPLSKAVVRFAGAQDIRVTVLQHGVIAGPFGYRETEGDRVAAWGPADAEWFSDALGPSVRVEATGCPRYDSILMARTASSPSDRGAPRSPPVVLFASQPFVQDDTGRSPWDRDVILQMVLESARRLPEARLIVKWHPSETSEPLADRQLDTEAREHHRARTFDLLEDADVVLVISSTVALEAMLLDRPVVFLGPPVVESPFHPPEDGAGARAQDVGSLVSVIRGILRDPEARSRILEGQRAYLTRTYAALDGKAADRIVRFLRGP